MNIERTDLTRYGLNPSYSEIKLGDFSLYATKVDFWFDEDFVQMNVQYRGAEDVMKGNLELTSFAPTEKEAVAAMVKTLNGIITK